MSSQNFSNHLPSPRPLACIEIVTAEALVQLSIRAFYGDREADRMLQAGMAEASRVEAALTENPAGCACCGASLLEILPPMVCVIPEDEAAPVIAAALCDACGGQPGMAILQSIATAFVSQSRPVVVTHRVAEMVT